MNPLSIRTVARTGFAVGTATLASVALMTGNASPASAQSGAASLSFAKNTVAAAKATHDIAVSKLDRFDRPYSGYMPADTTLRSTSPQAAGLDPAVVKTALGVVAAGSKPPVSGGLPAYPSAVTLLVHNGKIVADQAVGQSLKYSDNQGDQLPKKQQINATTSTIYDMASLTKLFTSILAVQEIQKGDIDVNAPVAKYVPEFAENGKADVTIKELLTHTSGFAPDPSPGLWQRSGNRNQLLDDVLTYPLAHAPGTTYVYSDMNMISMGAVLERVTGKREDVLVKERIAEPLGLKDTGYLPPKSKLRRIAATEYQSVPDRGLVWGQVHDENAWALGGVSGHAGVFSTAHDLAILGQTMLNGGTYNGHRILSKASVTQMITNFNQKFPGDEHGLGFELNQMFYMGGLSGPVTAGHTGYTGTDIVIDFQSRSIAILLTNRVHPNRNGVSTNPYRQAADDGIAHALAVVPRVGTTAWYTGGANATTSTLTSQPMTVPSTGAIASFKLWADTEESDLFTLQGSTDGGKTYTALPMTVKNADGSEATVTSVSGTDNRRWRTVTADVPGGTVQLRWQLVTDQLYLGRGVYADGIKVAAGRQVLLDDEKKPGTLTGIGWSSQTH